MWGIFFSVSHICKQSESLMVTFTFSPQVQACHFEWNQLTFLHFHKFHLFLMTMPAWKMINVEFIECQNYLHWMIKWPQMLQEIMVVKVQYSLMTLKLRLRLQGSF